MIPAALKEILAPVLKSRSMLVRDDLMPTLRAVLARLVPTDQDPDALELGAEAFIEGRMTEFPDLRTVYEGGLDALVERDFIGRSNPDQDALLQDFESRYPEFMAVVAAHAVEAVYIHPRGLAMVGFEVTA